MQISALFLDVTGRKAFTGHTGTHTHTLYWSMCGVTEDKLGSTTMRKKKSVAA